MDNSQFAHAILALKGENDIELKDFVAVLSATAGYACADISMDEGISSREVLHSAQRVMESAFTSSVFIAALDSKLKEK